MAGPFSKYQDVAGGFNVGEIGGRPNGRPVGVLNGQGQAPNQFSNPALEGMNRSQLGPTPMPGQGPTNMVPGTNPVGPGGRDFGERPLNLPWEAGSLARQNPTLTMGIPASQAPAEPAPWLKTASAAAYGGMDQAAREAYNSQMNQQKASVAGLQGLTNPAYKALGTPEREAYNQQMTLKNNMALQDQRRQANAPTGGGQGSGANTPLQQRQAAIAASQNAPGQGQDRLAARQAADRAARQANRANTRTRTWGGQVR
jgi:hypothetical protein